MSSSTEDTAHTIIGGILLLAILGGLGSCIYSCAGGGNSKSKVELHPAVKSCHGFVHAQVKGLRYHVELRALPYMQIGKYQATVIIPYTATRPPDFKVEEWVNATCYFEPPKDINRADSLNKSPFDLFEMVSFDVPRSSGRQEKFTLQGYQASNHLSESRKKPGVGYIMGWEGIKPILSLEPLNPEQLKAAKDAVN